MKLLQAKRLLQLELLRISFYREVVNIGRLILCAPEQNSNFTPVHKDEAFSLVGHISSEATSHNAMPSRKVHCVKFVFHDFSNVIKNSSLLESEGHAIDCLLLHVLVHVCKLNDSILCCLLINSTVRLDCLCVLLTLPFRSFIYSGVSLLSSPLRQTHSFQLIITLN